MQSISEFGDSAVLLPLSIVLIALVWRFQSRTAAGVLTVALALCVLLTLLLKVGFIACHPVWHTAVVSPSGHASFSIAVYGALALIVARQAPSWQQPPIFLLCLTLVGGIAASRVVLGAHSVAEVTLGLLVGAVALGLFASRYLRLRVSSLNPALLLLLVIGVLLVFHGAQLPLEEWIRAVAHATRTVSGACVLG